MFRHNRKIYNIKIESSLFFNNNTKVLNCLPTRVKECYLYRYFFILYYYFID